MNRALPTMDTPGDRPFAALGRRVNVVEVGPRDGLQNIDRFIPTPTKIELVNRLVTLGFDRVEVTSFVHPLAVPQMRDAEEVMAAARRGSSRLMALVPNRRGAERALASAVDMLDFVLSASESHNRANLNQSVGESLADLAATLDLAQAEGVPLRLTIATAFGCPFEGAVEPRHVLDLARRGADMGVAEVCLGDTTGMADPLQVHRLFQELQHDLPATPVAVHLHNSRGAGAANLLAALLAGVTTFDAAVGGMGGCPYAPGATGNICTEDMVNMLHRMGMATGVDLDGLIAVAREAEGWLDLTFPGQVIRAGATDARMPLSALAARSEG
jgi:hydroxymethylglutaryl-CoA lyase